MPMPATAMPLETPSGELGAVIVRRVGGSPPSPLRLAATAVSSGSGATRAVSALASAPGAAKLGARKCSMRLLPPTAAGTPT